MAEIFDIDILICGAGAAGLTLAIELARRHVAFRIIEQLDSPFRGSRGKGIQPRTLEVFGDLGLADRELAHGRRQCFVSGRDYFFLPLAALGATSRVPDQLGPALTVEVWDRPAVGAASPISLGST